MIFKPGRYYVGDLCYAIADDDWDNFCEMAGDDDSKGFDMPIEGLDEPVTVWYASTVYGDGEYFDQNGQSYFVDAGLIGVMPFEVAEPILTEEFGHKSHLGFANMVDFECSFIVESKDGVIYIGPLVIDTNQEDDDESMYYEGDYDDGGE